MKDSVKIHFDEKGEIESIIPCWDTEERHEILPSIDISVEEYNKLISNTTPGGYLVRDNKLTPRWTKEERLIHVKSQLKQLVRARFLLACKYSDNIIAEVTKKRILGIEESAKDKSKLELVKKEYLSLRELKDKYYLEIDTLTTYIGVDDKHFVFNSVLEDTTSICPKAKRDTTFY